MGGGITIKPDILMPDDPAAEKEKQEGKEQAPTTSGIPLKPAGEVELTHLDWPPSSGKHSIHPRRPAPIVPSHNPEKPDGEPIDK
jgi:hypothetical protein